MSTQRWMINQVKSIQVNQRITRLNWRGGELTKIVVQSKLNQTSNKWIGLERHKIRNEQTNQKLGLIDGNFPRLTVPPFVLGRPSRSVFKSEPMGMSVDSYNLTWKIDSYAPIEEYKLMFRKLQVTPHSQHSSVPIVSELAFLCLPAVSVPIDNIYFKFSFLDCFFLRLLHIHHSLLADSVNFSQFQNVHHSRIREVTPSKSDCCE